MHRIDKIEYEDKNQFDSIKSEFQSYLGWDTENNRVMLMHPHLMMHTSVIDKKSVADMTDADFLSLLVELWQNTEFKHIIDTIWQTESFSKFKK